MKLPNFQSDFIGRPPRLTSSDLSDILRPDQISANG